MLVFKSWKVLKISNKTNIQSMTNISFSLYTQENIIYKEKLIKKDAS